MGIVAIYCQGKCLTTYVFKMSPYFAELVLIK